MAGQTRIEWTDCSWNPTVGCTVCAAGCTNCYAMRMAARLEAMGVPHYAGTTRKVNGNAVWTGKIALAPEDILTQPLRWKKPRRIFVNSMSDLFHEDVPDEVIAEVFGIMAVCGARDINYPSETGQFGAKWNNKTYTWYGWKGPHIFQILTKRPQRMNALLNSVEFRRKIARAAYKRAHNQRDAGYLAHQIDADEEWGRCYPPGRMWPLSNVWLGTSVSTQADADANIPELLATPAAVRFVSLEPMLGPVDLDRWLWTRWGDGKTTFERCVNADRARLDWVICGGESGPGARPMDPDWARSVRDQCKSAGVSFFMKQMAKKAPIPDDLMIREWPGGASPQRANGQEEGRG